MIVSFVGLSTDGAYNKVVAELIAEYERVNREVTACNMMILSNPSLVTIDILAELSATQMYLLDQLHLARHGV